jgi:two-component system nitrogen regulation response regulator GlnG
MSSNQIWLVDDDASIRYVLTEALRDAGMQVRSFEQADAALNALKTEALPAVILTDIRMPGMSGIDFLETVRKAHVDLPMIVMSAFTDITNTAGAYRGGAFEYIAKPFDLDEVLALVEKAMPKKAKPAAPAADPASNEMPALIGHTSAMRELFRQIGRMAQLPLSVLITGETGTGKELVARALHRESPRSRKPFIALNTAAIPNDLLESELFGHEAGAFTGASQRHIGRFEQAQGGTLFLDEIGDMPLALQTRLLRVLAEGEFYRVGGRELIKVDVRVIAATHQPLEQLVSSNRFRADLLHRLNVLRIQLPALRERREDIPLLATHFCQKASQQLQSGPKTLSAGLMENLQAYEWPGNVRELENVCWRLVSGASHEHLEPSDWIRTRASESPSAVNTGDTWQELLSAQALQRLQQGERAIHAGFKAQFDQSLLEAALRYSGGHRQQAAQLLGLGRNTVTRKLGSGRKPKDEA